LLVGAATNTGGAAAQGGLRLQEIGSFDNPVYVTAAPGAPNLLFVVEQTGSVAVMRDDKKLDRPFLNISDIVKYGGEQACCRSPLTPATRATSASTPTSTTTKATSRLTCSRQRTPRVPAHARATR
jgi:hypothetical protein